MVSRTDLCLQKLLFLNKTSFIDNKFFNGIVCCKLKLFITLNDRPREINFDISTSRETEMEGWLC